MITNMLIALTNLIKNPISDMFLNYRSANRANSIGDALEYYIKDLFCESLLEKDLQKKNEIYNKYFSYIGNQNNPPDIMIKKGDAIEVKKIESIKSDIALNSSYPKDRLYSDNPMITSHCRNCEDWKAKDIIYSIGVVSKNKLKVLWFVYGDCYAASKEIYERIKNKISSGINQLEGVEFAETSELGRVNKVDPLGITYLRIRGMWGISNPAKVFDYLKISQGGSDFAVNAIMQKNKYLSFPKGSRAALEKLQNRKLSIKDVKIKSPNNSAKLLEAKLIRFTK